MKILILNTWYYPNMMGGAEHSVKILAENLSTHGNDVAIYSIDNRSTCLTKDCINNVTVYRDNGRKYNLYSAYLKELKGVDKIINKTNEILNQSIQNSLNMVLCEFKPDIVHCNCFSGISYLLFSTVKKNNIPLVLTLRNYYVLYPANVQKIQNYFLNCILTWCYNKLSNHFVNYTDAVTAPSLFTLDKHLEKNFFPNAMFKECIPNCIDIPYSVTLDVINEKKSRANDNVMFLYAGWISEDKGIRHLISAFNKINNKNASLVLCGDGTLRDFVIDEAQNDNRISFLGKLSTEELYMEYKKADVLIVPSIWEEPFGRVIIEGNAFGLPVICSDRGGIPEIIKQLKSGIIYPANDTKQLLEAMLYMLDRKNYVQYYENIVKNIEFYSVSNQISLYENLYKRVLSYKSIHFQ